MHSPSTPRQAWLATQNGITVDSRDFFWKWGVLAVLVVVMCGQMWVSVRRLSITSDEADHLHAGYRYLQCRDFGWNPEHPPLVKMIAAVPLLAMQVNDPIRSPCGMPSNKLHDFQVGHDFVFANSESVLTAGRTAVSILAVLLLVTVWFFARTMFGPSVAAIAGILIAFEPNLLAHGSLIMTDVPAALGFCLAIYSLYSFLSNRNLTRLIILGLATGIALGLKHSTILLVAILPALLLVDMIFSDRQAWLRTLRRNLGALAVVGIIALAVLWGMYGFRYASRPNDAQPWTTARLGSAHGIVATRVIPAIERRHLLPQAYLIGLQDILVESDVGKRMFIVGHIYPTGRWFYFPLAATIKFTLPTLLLVAISTCAWKFWRSHKREVSFLLIPTGILFASAMTYTINIGIRHILPVLPFLAIYGSAGTWSMVQNRKWPTLGLVSFLIFHAASSLHAFPNYLSYGNEIWGGPANTYKYLSDSNVDMGQALKMARRYVADNSPSDCWLVQPYDETTSDYAIPCEDVNTRIPPLYFTGRLIVSSILVDRIMSPYGPRSADIFKGMQPKAKLGGSALFVYQGTFDLTPMVSAERLKLASSRGPREPLFAIDQAQQVLLFDPQNGMAHAVLCYAYATIGDRNAAEEHCNLALKLIQQDPYGLENDLTTVKAFMLNHGLHVSTGVTPSE